MRQPGRRNLHHALQLSGSALGMIHHFSRGGVMRTDVQRERRVPATKIRPIPIELERRPRRPDVADREADRVARRVDTPRSARWPDT